MDHGLLPTSAAVDSPKARQQRGARTLDYITVMSSCWYASFRWLAAQCSPGSPSTCGMPRRQTSRPMAAAELGEPHRSVMASAAEKMLEDLVERVAKLENEESAASIAPTSARADEALLAEIAAVRCPPPLRSLKTTPAPFAASLRERGAESESSKERLPRLTSQTSDSRPRSPLMMTWAASALGAPEPIFVCVSAQPRCSARNVTERRVLVSRVHIIGGTSNAACLPI